MAVVENREASAHRFASHSETPADHIAEQAEIFARALVKSFHFSKGKPLAHAEYLLALKQDKGVDLLAYQGQDLMADPHIHERLLTALAGQHPEMVANWVTAPADVLSAELQAVLNIARRLEQEQEEGSPRKDVPF